MSTPEIHPAFATILERDGSEECRAHPTGDDAPPVLEHCLSFETREGRHLVQLDTTGAMPIPDAGQVIVLHDQPVRALSSETAYTRLQGGRPVIYTTVVVDPLH
ncbi:hypothetical protein ACFWUT_23390 [Streptomyces cyaneofuscatus]|uniref:hypothetical protein n=1 Tax=Streptomyces cyaneofuscatus TaxID=66883 RepID=UPI003666E51D